MTQQGKVQVCMAKALPSVCSCSIAWPWALGMDCTWSDIEVLLCDYFPLNLVCFKPFLAYHIIYTQIPLGYLWNCLLIHPPDVCILAWLIFYLKIPTEICYSLFTQGAKLITDCTADYTHAGGETKAHVLWSSTGSENTPPYLWCMDFHVKQMLADSLNCAIEQFTDPKERLHY